MIFVILFGVLMLMLFCAALLFHDIWQEASPNADESSKGNDGAQETEGK